tara:strand:- start:575 stop:1090 length:516 start_codon:yes stop_codon:yes gene_type:complete
MRFVKFTLVGLIGVTLTFMSLGFFHTSFQYENTIEVAASVEQSYKTFTNDSLNAEWLPGFIGVEVLSGAPLVPGSRFLITFEQDGERVSMVEVLREVKENEKFIVDMETEVFKGKVAVYFEGDTQKSTVKVYTTIEGSTLFYRSMFYLLKGSLQKQSQLNYDLLKELIESN